MDICIVDNNKLLTHTIEAFLLELGYGAMSFADAGQCLWWRAQTHEQFDVIMLGADSPGISGQTLSQIHEKFPEAVIFLMTDGCLSFSLWEVYHNGVYGFLDKPVRLKELELQLIRISEYLTQRIVPVQGDLETETTWRR